MREKQLLACSNSDIMIVIRRAPNLGLGTVLWKELVHSFLGLLVILSPFFLSLTIFEVSIEE